MHLNAGYAWASDISEIQADELTTRQKLLALTQNFVKKVRAGYQKADEYYDYYFASDLRAQDSFAEIPDGEILLLQIALSRRLKLRENVLAIKQGRDVMISLSEFTTVALFPIDVVPEKRIAEGWFIREDNPFLLDLESQTVRSGDNAYSILPDDILEEDGDIFVRGSALAEWMGFEMEVSLQQQSIKVQTTEKWPVQAALDRAKRKARKSKAPPSLPRQETPYKLADIPNADLNVRHQYRRRGDTGAVTNRTSYNVRASGDLASHTADVSISGTDEEYISSVRATFSRESDQPDMLGPLGARFYEFGDINVTSVPLAGASKRGLGLRVTNETPNFTRDTQTSIVGEGIAGWDVEVYKGTRLIGTGQVDQDGLYSFDNIKLFPGQNKFRIVFYGPFGEVRESEEVIYAGTDLFADTGVYDFSITAADTQFVERDKIESDDKGQLQFSGLYERQVAPNVTARAGGRTSVVDGQRKAYAQTGVTANVFKNLVNLDTAYDVDGSFQVAGSVRRRLGAQEASITGVYTAEDYGVANDKEASASYSLSSSLGGRLGTLGNYPIRYDLDAEYSAVDEGSTTIEGSASLSTRVNRLNISQDFDYSHVEDNEGQEERLVDGSTNIAGSLLGNRWRASAQYGLYPEVEAQQYTLDVTRGFARKVRGTLDLDYDPRAKALDGRASLTYVGKHLTVSPSVTYDNDQNLGAFLNVRSALTYDPYNDNAIFTSRPIATNGGISAFVFLDKDGDKVFSDGDEMIEGAKVQAIHANRSAITDENGTAFIYNLPEGKVTDTVIDENSLPDVFWISGYEGVSVAPRPGHVTRVNFPVHMSGEIDGTVYKENPLGGKSTVANVRLGLYRISDGALVQSTSTASDGFYLFERVPPDAYYILLNTADVEKRDFAAPAPKPLNIGYDGTIIYAHDITVRDGLSVGFDIPKDLEDFAEANPAADLSTLEDQRYVLNLGRYHSQALMGLVWYKVRALNGDIMAGSSPLVAPSESHVSVDSDRHVLRVLSGLGSLEEASQQCQRIALHDVPCTVEILPKEMEVSALSAVE